MAGFNKLMRYCDTIAEYERAKEEGIVTDDVLVIVLEDKVAKFKGQTFDWSGGGGSIDTELSETSENAVSNAAVTKAIVENEEVTAAALNELNERVNAISENVSGETATKVELQTAVESLTNTILENEEITAAALNDLNTRLESISRQLASLMSN